MTISYVTKSLQWSQDGTKVLMYVDDLGTGHCKKDDFGLTWCWIVADSTTGRVLWSPARDPVSEAALSPDGNWVAVSYGFYDSIGFYTKYTIVSTLDRRTVRTVLMNAVSILCWAR